MAARAQGFCLFDTVLGSCGVAWGVKGLVGVQLPEADVPATRRRMTRDFPGVPEREEMQTPADVQAAIHRIQGLLEGSQDPLLDVELDMTGVPEFNRRVY